MSAGRSRNLDGLLKDAQVAYLDSAERVPPVDDVTLARRARHVTEGVRFGLGTPEAMRRLREATTGIDDTPSLTGLLPRVLDGAVSLMGADFGNIQLVDPGSGALRIVTESGFDDRFTDYFAVVDDDASACGRAAEQGAQVVVGDVEADPAFAPHRAIAATSGFRAVQSTPLVDHAGRLVGMMSTHFQRPRRPSGVDLRIVELYADFAGDAIAAHLDALKGADPGVRTGRAVISMLHDLGEDRDRHPFVPALPDDVNGRDPLIHPDDTTSRYAQFVVTQLFSVGVRLGTARTTAATSPAADQLAAATREIDHAIRAIQKIMLSRDER